MSGPLNYGADLSSIFRLLCPGVLSAKKSSLHSVLSKYACQSCHVRLPRGLCLGSEFLMMNYQRLYDVNSACMLIVVSILLGAFYFQFGLHENPCPLCLLQRMGMIGVIVGLAMNTQFGFQRIHFAAVNLAALVGAMFSIRQVLLHVCPIAGKPSGYGDPIGGMHLYSWGVLIFAASILGSSILSTLVKDEQQESTRKPSLFEQVVFQLAAMVCLANVAATFAMCWLGPCCDDGPCP